ncbi:MAG: hemolysin family protein [Bacteroidota bacterium]
MQADYWIILLTLLLSAFFSGIEIAFVSSNKLKIEMERNRGTFGSNALSRLIKSPTNVIGALLLGNNIALVLFSMSMANVLDPLMSAHLPLYLASGFWKLLLQTVLSTLIILFLAEFSPKLIFSLSPNSFLKALVLPLQFFYYLLYPFVFLTVGIAEVMLKWVCKIKLEKKEYVFSHADLDHFFQEYSENNENIEENKPEIQIFKNAMEFRDVKLRECMLPRTEIVAIEDNDSISSITKKFIETGYSKILVYNNNIDNIIGYVHSFDIFKKPKAIKDIMRPILIQTETSLAHKTLDIMLNERKNIALVLDEFGGTSGIVTMEDIIEEIFGEIDDEYDTEQLTEKKVNELEYIFSGRQEIDYLNQKYNFDLPVSDEYETLAGLVMHYFERIPLPHEEISIPFYKFRILQASNKMIHQILLTIEKE